MVRTKADSSARKAVAAKAPRKVLGANAGGGGGACNSGMMSPKAAGKYAGGNSACDRPTPDWQKSIGNFFNTDVDKENSPSSEVPDEEVEIGEPSSVSASSSISSTKPPSDVKCSEESKSGDEECPESTEDTEETAGSSSVSPAKKAKRNVSPAKKAKRNGIIDSDSDDD